MQHCHLCLAGKLATIKPKPNYYVPNISKIIASCNKHLENDVFLSVNWNFTFDPDPFCSECIENTVQLLELDTQLEQINHNIKQLVCRITEKVITERRNYELPKHPENSFALQNEFGYSSQPTIWTRELNQERGNEDAGIGSFPVSHLYDEGSSHLVEEEPESINSSESVPHSGDRKKIKRKKKSNPSNSSPKKIAANPNTTITSSDLQLQKGNSGFVCSNCNKKFTRLDILQRHECGSQTFECTVCGKSFSSQGSLNLHKKIHTGEKPYKCDTCGKGFGLPHHLRLHIRTHTGERPYECEFCKKRFNDIGYLAKHKLQHSVDESERRKYKCDICSKSFTLYSTLKKHLVKHTGDSSYKCDTCGKAFGSSTILKIHQLVHTKEKSHSCTFCWKSFARIDVLRKHMLTHESNKAYMCEQCGKSFYTPDTMRMHYNLKHGEQGEFICDICGRIYKTEIQLNQHRRTHREKPKLTGKFTCVVCQRTYSLESDLVRHQKATHIANTVQNTVCQKCGTQFEDVGDFQRHGKRRMAKSESFRFRCDVCEDVTPSRCELICHFKEKHPKSQLPHPCNDCEFRFMTKSELYRHKRHSHETLMVKTYPKERKKTKKPKKNPRAKSGTKKKTSYSGSDMESDQSVGQGEEDLKEEKASTRGKRKLKLHRKVFKEEEESLLRRSPRAGAGRNRKYSESDENSKDDSEPGRTIDGNITGESSSEESNHNDFQIKQENDDLIKQEPQELTEWQIMNE